MPNKSFSVDTHLFRELGELLVTRNSTALVELIKNAYDADATRVTIEGRNLKNPKVGSIKITDDGVGMNAEQFERGFLSIASRFKDDKQRKSVKFARRYTGAKGIGRLAAHKLAKLLEIESFPDPTYARGDDDGVHAQINWHKIETELKLFSDIPSSGAVIVDSIPRRRSTKSGTTITLTNLRKEWTDKELVAFKSEVESYQPPAALVELPDGVLASEPLFERPKVADIDADSTEMTCELIGDFETGDDLWEQVATTARWLIEVDASSTKRDIRIRISPTQACLQELPNAQVTDYRTPHPSHEVGPHFQARVFVREGNIGNRGFKQWLGQNFGIRLYNEGFRVLPYGEPGNDWLSLDADTESRGKRLKWLDSKVIHGPDRAEPDENEGLSIFGNSGYFGAVFLTTADAPHLKMVVSREGFVAHPSFDNITDVMRTALYLSVRVRAAATLSRREERREKRQGAVPSRTDLKQQVHESRELASSLAQEARQQAAQGNFSAANKKIEQAVEQVSLAAQSNEQLMAEGPTLRVLASVGTQMAAFVHEINGILGMSRALEAAVNEIEQEFAASPAQRRRLKELRSAIEDLRRGIERQASYLTDVISPDARRRRSRLKLADRFDAAVRLISAPAARQGIEIENEIPADFKSQPMFPAELTVVFSNLLTNAVKAAGEDGRIRATGKTDAEGRAVVIVENTGVAVELATAERWFRPFESTTVESDPVLGQGMGMGLPITRNLLEDYGAKIAFCVPSRGFKTALKITFLK